MYPFMFILICLFGYVNAECLIDTLPQETTSSAPEVSLDSTFHGMMITFSYVGTPTLQRAKISKNGPFVSFS